MTTDIQNTPRPVGRPRTVSPPPEELEALGVEMVDWFENHPEALHISCWYSVVKFFTDSAWETIVKRQEFVGYYEKAKRIIAHKYLDKTSNVREGISQRWQRVYYKDLKNSEDQDLDDAAKRAKTIENSSSPLQEQLDQASTIMRQQFEIITLKKRLEDAGK